MAHTLRDLATALNADLFGDGDLPISGAAEPAMARGTDIALAMSEKYADGLAQGNAKAAILWQGADYRQLGLQGALIVRRPRYAMSGLTQLLDRGPEIAAGVHPTALVDPTAKIGDNAAIGPFVVIHAGAVLGANARIASHVSIGRDTTLGDNALVHAGVRIGHEVSIGADFIAQPNAVIGSDGFSFVTPEKSNAEQARANLASEIEATDQSWTRIHSLGGVVIGDDVEIGAGATIDRGTIRATEIGRGTKLDNMVHLGHNVVVGQDCLLCGQVGIAGSTIVGNRVVMAGQCGASDNITIGDDVVAAGATKIYSNVPAGRMVWGNPAVKMETHLAIQKSLRRLPRWGQQLADLQKSVSKIVQKD